MKKPKRVFNYPKRLADEEEVAQRREKVAELRYLMRLSIKEIAEAIQCSVGTVMSDIRFLEKDMKTHVSEEKLLQCFNEIRMAHANLRKKGYRNISAMSRGTREYVYALSTQGDLVKNEADWLGTFTKKDPIDLNITSTSKSEVTHSYAPETVALVKAMFSKSSKPKRDVKFEDIDAS